MSLREQFGATTGMRPIPADIDGWPAETHIRLLSYTDATDARTVLIDESRPEAERLAYFVAACLCDANCEPVFDPRSPDDLDYLSRQPYRVLQAAFDKCVSHNKLGDTDDELKKNSPTTVSGDSGSDYAAQYSECPSPRPSNGSATQSSASGSVSSR